MTHSLRHFLRVTSPILVISMLAAATITQASDNIVKIGVINDQSGAYADLAGPGSVVAAKLAVEDFGGSVLGKKIEIVSADHQLKPDVGTAIIRRWFDVDGVDMVIDVSHSAIGLAAQQIAKERNRVVIVTAVGTTDFTGKACTSTSVSWMYDTYALTNGVVQSVVQNNKLDTWFLIVVDYAFGISMEADARRAVNAAGGKVVGSVHHPLGTADFSSYILQAQASGAKAVLLANGGSDLINSVKQFAEFTAGQKGQTLVTPLMFITDVKALGLRLAAGLTFTTPFYWDRTVETRAWAKRFFDRHGAMPTMVHAAVYSGVQHYLRSVKAAGTDEAQSVMRKMRGTPVDDFYVHGGQIRPDGRLLHPMYLVKVKTADKSKGPWDFYEILGEIPGDKAFRSLEQSGCPLASQVK